jgi:Surface lipoprotein
MKQLLLSFLLFFMTNTLAFAEEDVDPFEDINRVIYDFNETIDDNLLEPTSRAYKENTPDLIQRGISNFLVICVMCPHWLTKYYNSNPLKV